MSNGAGEGCGVRFESYPKSVNNLGVVRYPVREGDAVKTSPIAPAPSLDRKMIGEGAVAMTGQERAENVGRVSSQTTGGNSEAGSWGEVSQPAPSLHEEWKEGVNENREM